MAIDAIFSIGILILSVVLHELSHGYAALSLGDPTARYAGRLTLNPLKHLDPIGSIAVPIMLAILPPHIVFGWAKPVPYNSYNLKNQRWGETIVAAAGPAANIFLALFFGLLIRLSFLYGLFSDSFLKIAAIVVITNLVLAVFNLMPVPPLDGFKFFFGFLPYQFSRWKQLFERHSLLLLFFFAFFIWQFVAPLVGSLFSLITGLPLS